MFPLDLLAEPWQTIVRLLPFQYLAYFPAAIFLGKIAGADLVWGLVQQMAWLVALIVSNRVAFNRGVRRYSGYGG